MKYVSLDLETTCLAPKESKNILGISMVIEDTENDTPVRELPHFTCVIDQGRFEGEAVALAMNSWILKMIADGRRKIATKYPVRQNERDTTSSTIMIHTKLGYIKHDSWLYEAIKFLEDHFGPNEHITVAGKNVAGFDMNFLPKELQSMFRHRVIDVGSVFIDWGQRKSANVIPSLDALKERYGMGAVSHDMYDDACDVIEILRKSYPKKVVPAPLTEEERVPLD